MKINEIKIYGFKSFANKTSIRFDDNFVGIVGPNGSGKSNIIDAIRWVFGEQSSKNMRTKSGIDVIFGGTETKAKLNFAEVTLVLDNNDNYLPLDYNEVSVTRRLYRSGESEYLLNGIDCRLKDINELLMDSGMGKNSFSIISQGKIEEIVVSKPENRRQVIEEVAGVLKYKKRKELAVGKLKKTDDNLAQVDLILGEMNERLGPLERQSATAIKFLELKDKLEKHEISYLANKINITKDDFSAYEEVNNQIEVQVTKLNTKITTLDTSLFEGETVLNHNSLELSQLVANIGIKNDQINSLQTDFKVLNERKLNLATNQEEKRSLKLENQIFSIGEKIQTANIQYTTMNLEYDVAKEKFDKVEDKINVIRSERYRLNEELSEIKQSQELNSYPFAVKKIIENPDFSNAKVIRDVFTTKERYNQAITSAFGGRINEVIMEDINQVKLAISFLKNAKYGRATFIPLNQIKEYHLDKSLLDTIKQASGFIGIAKDLVDHDEKYNKAFNNILGTTIIIDGIDNANHLAKKTNNRHRIITLEGDLISTSGTISGGAMKKQNLILNNEKSITLKKELSELDILHKNLTDKIQEIEKDYQRLRVEVSVEKDYIDSLINDKKIREYELSNIKNEADQDANIEVNNIEVDLEKLRIEFQTLNDKKTSLQQTYDDLNEKKTDDTHTLRNLNEELKIIVKKQNENNITLTKLEMTLSNALDTLSEEYNLSFEIAFSKADKNIDLDLYKDEVDKLKRQIKSLGIVNIAAIEEYQEIKERHDFIYVQKEDLIKAKLKLESIMNKLDEFVITQFDDVYHKLRAEFKLVFTELFGGGQADLVLTDPTDLLNTGVEIVAQPPGKKLQTISLLSGGEKSLTAISLLFAILRVRTVPFAILDEVEAALDEANVKRYAKYIKIFSENTQFLVITHRQGTMEHVDTLYGVTMVEKGISSIVKVKLNDGDKDV